MRRLVRGCGRACRGKPALALRCVLTLPAPPYPSRSPTPTAADWLFGSYAADEDEFAKLQERRAASAKARTAKAA